MFLVRTAAALLALAATGACAGVRMQLEPELPACRAALPASAPVRWISPSGTEDRRRLRAWCDAVGPVEFHEQGRALISARPVTLVSWNMHVGEGDLAALVRSIRPDPNAGPDLILLIQEAYRSINVPASCPAGSRVGGRLGARRRAGSADIIAEARTLGLHVVYAPSMRNGRERDCSDTPPEDRGNAILSTLPLSDVAVIELPFGQQRRTAVAAAVQVSARTLRVMSVHLDTAFGHRRQALGIIDAVMMLGWEDDVIVGGDFNAPLLDLGVSALRRHFVEANCGPVATHRNGRLDRLFTRNLRGVLSCDVIENFGSDHRALKARLGL